MCTRRSPRAALKLSYLIQTFRYSRFARTRGSPATESSGNRSASSPEVARLPTNLFEPFQLRARVSIPGWRTIRTSPLLLLPTHTGESCPARYGWFNGVPRNRVMPEVATPPSPRVPSRYFPSPAAANSTGCQWEKILSPRTACIVTFFLALQDIRKGNSDHIPCRLCKSPSTYMLDLGQLVASRKNIYCNQIYFNFQMTFNKIREMSNCPNTIIVRFK